MTLVQERRYIYVLDRFKLRTTYIIPGRPKALPEIDPTCADNSNRRVFIGKQSYNGYETYVYQETKTTPEKGQVTETRWRAPLLNCMDIYGELEVKSAQGEVKVYRNKVTDVVLGDPDPALFDVPGDYREVPPSEMEKERMAVLGYKNPLPTLMEHLKARDERYFKER
ncbi:MAG: hypothetical protein KIT09_07925 [Bryobacteraceae bacterium]|nr:hypothetical protein [Bryobacteraceae bacterium]